MIYNLSMSGQRLGSRALCVLDTLLPANAHPTLGRGLLEAGYERFHAEFLRAAPPPMGWALRGALWSAAWVSPLLIGRLPPLTRLEPASRERALEAMAASDVYLLRQALLLVKLAAGLCYGADPDVRRALGHPDP